MGGSRAAKASAVFGPTPFTRVTLHWSSDVSVRRSATRRIYRGGVPTDGLAVLGGSGRPVVDQIRPERPDASDDRRFLSIFRIVTSRRSIVAVFVALLVPLVLATSAGAYAGAPWFRPSQPYTENFPDPSVIRVGERYVAYGTSTGGAYLPAMTSTDLSTWIARPAYNPGPPLNSDPFFNDALPHPASWSPDRNVDGRMKKEVWSPGVAAIGGRY